MAKVLVIDDEPSIAALVAEIVETYGHEVTIAYNGRQGLELLKSGVFQMVISDIMMPYLNGHDLLDIIRADPKLFDICFILMSAVSHMAHLDHKVEADAFIVKPFDITVIDTLVDTFLKEHEPPALGPGVTNPFAYMQPIKSKQQTRSNSYHQN